MSVAQTTANIQRMPTIPSSGRSRTSGGTITITAA
jgi:hypothetical protein